MSPEPGPADLGPAEFALIGELIVNAAALEHMTVALAAALTRRCATNDVGTDEEVVDSIWRDVIGRGSAQSVRVCRASLDALSAEVLDADRRRYLEDLLDDVAGLFEQRHAIAHGLWEQDENGALITFRATPWRKQSTSAREARVVRVGGTPAQLRQLIEQSADATRDVIDAYRELWPWQWGSPPEEVRLRQREPGSARRPHGRLEL